MRTLPALLRPVAVGAVLLAAVPMLLAGCSSDSSDDTAGDSSTTSASGSSDTAWLDDAKAVAEKAATVPTTINAAANGPVKPPASMDLFFIGCDQSIPGCVAQVQGVQEAAEVLGYDVEVCDAKSDTASFQNCFSQAVNAKPDVIVNNARPASDAAESYADAHEADIPVIGQFTSEKPDPETGNAAEVGYVCGLEGELLGNYIVAQSEGKANVAVFADTVYRCNGQRAEGVEAAIKKCTTCEITVDRYSAATAVTDLPPALQAKIQSSPDLSWIVATPGFSGVMAADAIRQAGKEGSISVGTFDGDAPTLALVRAEDIVKADVASGVYENGWTVVDVAMRLANGQDVPDLIENPTQLLMNVDSAPADGTFEGADGFRDQFKELWGVQ
jgi:ribose transport system substrate-binding protein